MDLTERKLKILQAIIADFVSTAEPVGSRTISKKYELGSPATIRNEMSDLEELGYLTHPHTSSGRIPSEKAYRLYVDEMMARKELSVAEKESINAKLSDNVTELEALVERAAQVLSEITNLTAFAITPGKEQETIKYINLLPVDDYTVVLMIVSGSGKVSNTAVRLRKPAANEEILRILSKNLTYNYAGKTLSEALKIDIIQTFKEDAEAMAMFENNFAPSFLRTLEDMLNVNLYMDGLTNIFSLPEYSSIDKAKSFFEKVNKKQDITQKLISRDDGIIITIGGENDDEELSDCSIVTATYHVDGKMVGKLGVIGPTRMKYSEVTSVMEYLTENISNAFRLTEGDDDD